MTNRCAKCWTSIWLSLPFTSFRCAYSIIWWPPVMFMSLCSCTILSPLSWHLYKPVQVAFSQSQTSSTHNFVFLCVLFVRNDTQMKSLLEAIWLSSDASAKYQPEPRNWRKNLNECFVFEIISSHNECRLRLDVSIVLQTHNVLCWMLDVCV